LGIIFTVLHMITDIPKSKKVDKSKVVHALNQLNTALVAGEWSASCPGRFISGERVFCTHWIGGWVDHKSGLHDMEK
jgi:hypothetical protein